MKVSEQIHASVALLFGEIPLVPIDQESCSVPTAGMNAQKREKFRPFRELNQNFSNV
jgi:hypothetical protein